jgi:pyrroloquinoline quinone biosynthesis protein B
MVKKYHYYGRVKRVKTTSNANIPRRLTWPDELMQLTSWTENDYFNYYIDSELKRLYNLEGALVVGPNNSQNEEMEKSNRFKNLTSPTDNPGDTDSPTIPKNVMQKVSTVASEEVTHWNIVMLYENVEVEPDDKESLLKMDNTELVYLLSDQELNKLHKNNWRPATELDKYLLLEEKEGGLSIDFLEIELNINSGNSLDSPVDPPEPGSIQKRITVLGAADDGGIPHLNCECKACTQARKNNEVDYPTSLRLTGTSADQTLIFEASAELRHTIENIPDAFCISHDYGGSTAGLFSLGNEVTGANSVKIYCSEEFGSLIRSGGLYDRLLTNNNLEIEPVQHGEDRQIAYCDITFFELEFDHGKTNPLAYKISGADEVGNDLFYAPKIQNIESGNILEIIKEVDIALIDGHYWSQAGETRAGHLPRNIPRYMDVIDNNLDNTDEDGELETEIYFLNINHTNKVLHDHDRLKSIQERGYDICNEGQDFFI